MSRPKDPRWLDGPLLDAPPPVRTGKPPGAVDLTGMLLPWHDGQPDYIGVGGTGNAVVVFSTHAKLELARRDMPFYGTETKVITDGPDFLSSIPASLPVMVDIHFTPAGKVRYTLLLRD